MQEKEKVLVVDDEAVICSLLSEFLTLEGYQAVIACSGKEALSYAEREKPHVVLLDIKMPGMNGLDVLAKIKRASEETTIIIMTGEDTPELIAEAKALGADHCILKPFKLGNLRRLLASGTGSSGYSEKTVWGKQL